MALKPMSLKTLSWNVNGLRAVLRKGALAFLEQESPDIFCIQETKMQEGQADPLLQQYPYQYWNSAEKKGYSGTAIFSKFEPLSIRSGMGIPRHDREGRVLTLEYPKYYLINVYTPNAQRGLLRLPYRQKWDGDFRRFVRRLDKEKPVMLCGDLNVAHREIDLTHPKANRMNAGFTDEERAGFTSLLRAGFMDSFREFCQDGGHYTWWSFVTRARERNVGWRIDYFLLSKRLRPRLDDAFILPEIYGSDHCPVGVLVDI